MFFRRKKEHDEEVAILKKDIKRGFQRAAAPIKANTKTLRSNGITLEIKKALGGHHV